MESIKKGRLFIMGKTFWTEDKIELLKAYLANANLTYTDISNKIPGTTPDSIEHAKRRYGLKKAETKKRKEKLRWQNKEIVEEVKYYIEAVKAVTERYYDIYSKIKYKGKWQSGKQTEDQVQLFSDMHTGMINHAPTTGEVTYNQEIQEKELANLFQANERFYELYRPAYNIETFYVFGLGDLITNDRIYEGQQKEITCGVGKQIVKTVDYVSDYIRHLLQFYPNVIYINITGNHGRSTPAYISEEATNNFEYFTGLLLKERFQNNKRVEIKLAEDYSYTQTIKGHRYLLTHGNSIRGATLNSIEKASKEIALLVEQDPYDVICIGHFHCCHKLPISPKTSLLVNGCFIHKDNYAYTKLRKFSTAKQYLFNISKKSALHNLQELDLRWGMK